MEEALTLSVGIKQTTFVSKQFLHEEVLIGYFSYLTKPRIRFSM
jgi:hypothetical protein